MTGLAFLKNILFLFNVCSKCFDFLLQLLLPSYFWTVVLETTLENTLGSKEIKPVHPKGNQSWIFIGRTDAEAETPIFWPPDEKNWLIWKDPDAGKDRGQEEKETTEDEMVGRHHWLDRHESEQALGVGDGQGSLACCTSWGSKELDTAEWLNWTERQLYLTWVSIALVAFFGLD